MNKNSYFSIAAAVACLLACLAIVAMGAGKALAFQAPEGSDQVEETKVLDVDCFGTEKYMAVDPDFKADNNTLRIYAREPGMDLKTQCAEKAGKLLYTVEKEDPSYFSGILGDVVFVDYGCCPDPRGLAVVDLARKAELLDAGYMSEAEGYFRITDSNKLLYMAYIDEPETNPGCKDAAVWEQQGFSVLYQQPRALNLTSGEITDKGPITCTMGQ